MSDTNAKESRKVDRVLLSKLTSLAKQVARGNYGRARKRFELTKPATCPKAVSELAEAFGTMVVKVESREFRLAGLVEDLERTCKELAAAKRTLETSNKRLETKLKNRTQQLHEKNSALSRTMKEIKQESNERKLAEKNLQRLNQEIETTNRKLQDAYLWMRQKKDQLAARQYRESPVFLTSDDGRICGFTEKALDMTQKSRSALQNTNIQEVLRPREGQTFADLTRQVRPSMPLSTTLSVRGGPDHDRIYEAKLTRLVVDGKRLIYVVLYIHADP